MRLALSELQAQFWSLLAQEHSAPDPATLIHGTTSFTAQDRAALYQRMFLGRQEDALAAEFPTVKAMLGGAAFRALAEAYVPRHPSTHPSLSRRGHALAHFLRGRGEPGLADVAALEWARTEVFEEAPADLATLEDLSRLGAEGFVAATLQLIPALRRLELAYDAPSAWKQADNGDCVHDVTAKATRVVVWRQGFDVFHTTLDGEEFNALTCAAEQGTLADVCSAFTGESAAQTAFEKLASWLNDGWVAEVRG